jgi:hypothetical protein
MKSRSQSPYLKYGKRPHRYSEKYNEWHRAVTAGHHEEAARIGTAHSRMHGLRILKANGKPVRHA